MVSASGVAWRTIKFLCIDTVQIPNRFPQAPMESKCLCLNPRSIIWSWSRCARSMTCLKFHLHISHGGKTMPCFSKCGPWTSSSIWKLDRDADISRLSRTAGRENHLSKIPQDLRPLPHSSHRACEGGDTDESHILRWGSRHLTRVSRLTTC